MADTTGVLARLQAALSVYDPTWDVSVGSATYKILESVAQEIATANNNSVLQTYSYDINTKAGSELDAFTNLFGVYRQIGKRATGIVTFSVGSPATAAINIPQGTQVAVPIGNGYTTAIYFSTIASAVININSTSVDIPVTATIAGIIGNVPANSVTTQVSPLVGVTSVFNANPMTGGQDPESDAALQARWKNTAFSNTTGTQGKYNLTAQQNPNVNLVNTVGTQSFYSEQLQAIAYVSGSSSTAATFCFVAYSGMTVLTSTGTVTYTGAPTVVAYSGGFSSSSTGSAVALGIQAALSGIAPSYNVTVSATNSNTIANGFGLSFSSPSPYRLILGSGNTIPGNSVTTNGVTTISGTSFYTYIQSANPDIGLSGTMSYNGTFSGALYPQGNELVGVNVNSYNQSTFANITDYVYPSSPTAPLTITIANGSNNSQMFVGNTISLISEYIPAASRSNSTASGNYVDIFINGTSAATAYEQAVFNPSFTLSSGNSNNILNTINYTVASGNVAATITGTSGDYYVPFDVQPMINFPSQLNISNSGIADTFFLYNNTTGSGCTYPIALNKYPMVTFTGTAASGTTFVSVNNASGYLYPGIALASGTVTSGGYFFISSVTSSGIYLNQNTANAGTNVVMSGKALAYPLYDTTDNKNSVLQTTGLAIDSTTVLNGWPTLPSNLSTITYSHNYNSDVQSVEDLIQQSRPFGANTLVHQASFVPLIINATIVFSNNYSQTTVQSNIASQLSTFFGNYAYLGTISFNTLAGQILSVPGVANVRITSVSTTAVDGTPTNTFTKDFILASNQLPSLYAVNYTVKGASTF